MTKFTLPSLPAVTSAESASQSSSSPLVDSRSVFAPSVSERQLAAHRRAAWLHSEVTVGTPQLSPLRNAWAEWLGAYPWEAWGTLTFRESDFTNDSATRAWNRFAAFVFPPTIPAYFVGHEVGALGRLHLHCLLGPLTIKRSEAWDWWFKRYGRCEVRGYDPEKGAAHYVTKYVTKELAHYDVDLRGYEWASQCQHPQPNGGMISSARGRRRV